MTKLSNPTKLLLVSLAPLIAHQVTYGMMGPGGQGVNPPQQQQQLPQPPVLAVAVSQQAHAQFVGVQNLVAPQQNDLNGLGQGPIAAIANDQNKKHGVFQAFLNGFKIQNKSSLISKVTTSLAAWKEELENQNNNLAAGWKQSGRAILAQNIQANDKLKNVRDAFYNAILIDLSNNQGQAMTDRNAYIDNNNAQQQAAIFNAIQNLAKALYEFKDSDKWDSISDLTAVYALICIEDTIHVTENDVTLDQLGQGTEDEKDAQKAALQQELEEAIDNFMGTLAYWRGSNIITFSQHKQLQGNNGNIDKPEGVQKFETYFKQVTGDLKGVAQIDQFYQFSDINEHKIDLSDQGMEPEKFVNRWYLQSKFHNSYKPDIQMAILQNIDKTPYIQNLKAHPDMESMSVAIDNLDLSKISVKRGKNIIKEYTTVLRNGYLDTNNSWKDNIDQTPGDYDTVLDAIKDKIKTETNANDGLVNALLEEEADATQNKTLNVVIDEIVIDDYSQIDTLDDLVDAILNKLYDLDINHDQNPPYTQQNIKAKLKTIKFVDTPYYQSSLQKIQNQDNHNYDPKRAAEIDKILTFCQDNIGFNIQWDDVLIKSAAINDDPGQINTDIILKSIQYAYPDLTDSRINYFNDGFLTTTELVAATRASNSLEEILKLKNNDPNLNIGPMSATDLLNEISGITKDTIKQYGTTCLQLLEDNGDYIKKQDAEKDPTIQNNVKTTLLDTKTVIEPTADSIANTIINTQGLQQQLSTNNQFSGIYITKQDAENDPTIINTIKTNLISQGSVIAPTAQSIATQIINNQGLQQQLSTNNQFSGIYITKQAAVNDQTIINTIRNNLIRDRAVIEPNAQSIATQIINNQGLQQQLSNNNQFSNLYIKNDVQTILSKRTNDFVKKQEFDNLKAQYNDVKHQYEEFTNKNQTIKQFKDIIEHKSIQSGQQIKAPNQSQAKELNQYIATYVNLPKQSTRMERAYKGYVKQLLKANSIAESEITGSAALSEDKEKALNNYLNNSKNKMGQLREHIKGKNLKDALYTILTTYKD